MLQNDMGKALETFSDTYTLLMQERYSTKDIQREELVDRLQEAAARKNVSQMTKTELHQIYNFEKDMISAQIQFKIKTMDQLQRYFDDVTKRTSAFDLSSYDFEADPDCSILTKV